MVNLTQQYLNARAARERDVAARASDPEFRARLIAEPRATLEAVYGVRVPISDDIYVVEESATTHYVVLPPAALAGRGAELSDTELETVAGGVAETHGIFGTFICWTD